MTGRELDVVVHGATGFVGRLTARHLAESAPPGTRIGLAGRSEQRLAAVRDGLGPVAAAWPLIVADSDDGPALAALAARTTAVAATAGPYARLGLPLVRACAEAGTHYADLTGEVLFARRSADAAHDAAVASGARIVHSCGFDSVPSDLGLLLAHRAAGGGDLVDATYLLVSARGGVSGGTVDSVRGLVDEARRDPAARRLLADPYSLSPAREREPDLGSQPDAGLPRYDRELGRWVAPFVMASYNTRVVRRTNALTGWGYGRDLRYREVMGVGRGPLAPLLAGATAAGVVALVSGLALPPTRFVLDRVLPRPGSGPSEKVQQAGHFRVEVHVRAASGARAVSTVHARGDPGYAATAVMLGQSVLALALSEDLPDRAGVLTPVTGIGDALVDRLRTAGFGLSAA